MDWFNLIKWFYDDVLWTKDMVKDAVEHGKITEAQYQEITNEEYVA